MKDYEFSLSEYDWQCDDTKQVLRVMKREPTAAEWVKNIYKRYQNDVDARYFCVDQWTYVVDNHGNVGKACRNLKDKYDFKIGIAIAYARLRGLSIHHDFQSQTTLKFRTVHGYPAIEEGVRVYNRSQKLLGTVMNFSPAGSKLVTVKWDTKDLYVAVPKSSIRVAIMGES